MKKKTKLQMAAERVLFIWRHPELMKEAEDFSMTRAIGDLSAALNAELDTLI